MNKNWFIFVFLFVFLITGCEKLNISGMKKAEKPKYGPVEGTVVAKINNYPVTKEELEQEIEAFNMIVPEDRPEEKITTREQKIDYLKNDITRRILLYQDALAKGLDRNKEVVQALEKTEQDLLVVELIKQLTRNIDVTSTEIEDYYNTYKEQLREPEEREIREIVVRTEPEAREILIQLLQGTEFADLARQRSISQTRKEGGSLGFIKPGTKFPQFDNIAFSETLEVGRVSNIFKGPDGYYIIKLESKRGGKQRSLSELWDDIKRVLTFVKQQKKIDDLFSKLSREAKFEYYEDRIK